MVRLRAEKATLLGFGNYAEMVMDRQTAPDFAAVQAMLNRLAPAAIRNADAEAAALAESAGHPLEAWDWAYYSSRVRRERYEVDEQLLRPYFELDRVLVDGVFFAATSLFGITFHVRNDLEGYHPDVRVWEVRNGDGSELGLFLGDYYARDSKRGGAWMNSLVEQSALLGTKPVVINNLNISKPPAGEPTLLTLDEVRTTFHEFGHALHGLFSNVMYPRFSGTSVPGTSWSIRRRSTRCGSCGPRLSVTTPGTTRLAKRFPRTSSTASTSPSFGAKASPRRNTSAPPFWTWPGTCWTSTAFLRTRWTSKPRHWLLQAWRTPSFRPGTARGTSSTSSPGLLRRRVLLVHLE
ncbi:peptidyl-dipeptidase dcp [Arthrobacter sp. Hiyo8]|nr:peptidyl-dipeptidase dcp [Arthrobacter sp. Hiyo8]